ncbi:MAG: hypothetical protein V3S06_03950 [candidate division Zixibacteria bacterium]
MRKLLLMLFFLTMTGSAWALTDISVGAFGGLNTPIVQDDAKLGNGFGVKAKISPSPMIAGVLFFESRSFGDPELTIQGTTMSSDGGKVTAFGVEALIGSTGGGPGPHFYWAIGLSSYKWTRDGYDDVSEVSYHVGPGLEIVFPANIGIEGRAKFEVVPTDGGGSRKNILIFVGANYHFGLM